MKNYTNKKIYLSDWQIRKLKSPFKNYEEIRLQIDKSKIPNYDIYLTKTQINQIGHGRKLQ